MKPQDTPPGQDTLPRLDRSASGGAAAIRAGDDEAALADAAARLRAGGLVVFPTETVYGLGADARDADAVAAIFEAKGRPRFNPLIVHVADLPAAEAAALVSEPARALAEQFWPGPLTLVLPRRENAGLADLALAGLPSVAVRAPAHPVAQALLRRFAGPLAAPSANLSGRLSPTTAADAAAAMAGRAPLVLDGGSCAVGLESTILSLPGDGPARLLRPGGIALEDLEAALGAEIALGAPPGAAPQAPGALQSHYAPRATLRLNAAAPHPGEAWLGFGADPPGAAADRPARNLSPSGALRAAAANLFSALRALDDALAQRADAAARPSAPAVIAVAQVPETGLGRAINDRLRRAAAPRPGGPAEA